MIRRTLWVLMVLLISLPSAWATSTPDLLFQEKIFRLVSASWNATDRALACATDQSAAALAAYDAECATVEGLTREIGKTLVQGLEANDPTALDSFKEVYLSLDPAARAALFPVLDQLRAAQQHALRPALSEQQLREYFPGYGHTEYGYKYRKGRELEREDKGFRWQSEEQTITTNLSVELVINIDILGIFKGLLESGAIKNLKVGEPYQMTADGTPILVCKISFQANKTIVTKTNRKFEISKVWFELWRAKGTLWTTGPWELVGRTYVIMQEPTGDDVVTGVKSVKDGPSFDQISEAKIEP